MTGTRRTATRADHGQTRNADSLPDLFVVVLNVLLPYKRVCVAKPRPEYDARSDVWTRVTTGLLTLAAANI
jgi:hypothetical protein